MSAVDAPVRLVNCYQIHRLVIHPAHGRFPGAVTYRPLGIADGDPDRALADATAAGADGLLIVDVLTREQWFVPITPEIDVLCVYCKSNPVEPGLPFCDNGFCKAEAVREAQS